MSWEDDTIALAQALERDGLALEELTRLRQTMARLLEVLVDQGVLAHGQPRQIARLAESKARPRVHLAVIQDKRSMKGADIDCASRLHLCHARCCAMQVILSEEDVREGRFRFQLHQPYLMERAADGYCTHLREDAGCEHYEDRPGMCREFDCRNDERIWIDFEQRLAQPIDREQITAPRVVR
jgi:hypothetical protein